MNASALLLRSASRRAATGMTSAAASSVRTTAVRSASVLSGSSAYGAGAGAGAVGGGPTFQGSGFKAVGLRSLWSSPLHTSSSTNGSGRTARLTARSFSSTSRSLSFLADYDAHVTERAALADGLGVAPKPLDAAQVATLIEEIKGAKEGSPDSDRVRCIRCRCVLRSRVCFLEWIWDAGNRRPDRNGYGRKAHILCRPRAFPCMRRCGPVVSGLSRRVRADFFGSIGRISDRRFAFALIWPLCLVMVLERMPSWIDL